uniref:MADF domain-containing protein n=1 Tax=Glossina austeni TaxID=7395 RepID=A0A1A9UYI6_GLOAU
MRDFDQQELIRQISRKLVLYDQNFPGYGEKSLEDRAWQEINSAIDVPVYECRFKWRSLRESFTKNYKRNRHQGTYYNEMRFIIPYVTIARSGLDDQLRDHIPVNAAMVKKLQAPKPRTNKIRTNHTRNKINLAIKTIKQKIVKNQPHEKQD